MSHRPLCSTDGCGYPAMWRVDCDDVIIFMCASCRLTTITRHPDLEPSMLD